ncbi:MAG: nicotinate (nicotinamide) nucleotide adenylyltransferase [Phycisphaerae bacterium]|nr:nicotinate (nicotinamide) nucleotide adenylyltransferase [Phycisphaerae bacterium]
MNENKIALFGGTFDPIHLGHAAVTEFAAKKINASKVILIPAKQSPLKPSSPIACDADRLNMIKLAIENNPLFEASDYELNNKPPSFTINTVRFFKNKFHGSEIYWLLGADSTKELGYWYMIEELIDICHVCVMYRAGFPAPDFSMYADLLGEKCVKKLNADVIETPLIDISSTKIRKMIKEEQDIKELVYPKVAGYIQKHDLYR